MRTTNHIITVLVMLLASTFTANAGELSKAEQSYIAIALGTMTAAHLCGYSVVEGSLSKVGDRLGVGDDVGKAIFESIKATMGQSYDRSLLIPEVTQFVNQTVDDLAEVTKDKVSYCNKFVPVLLQDGTIQKKK